MVDVTPWGEAALGGGRSLSSQWFKTVSHMPRLLEVPLHEWLKGLAVGGGVRAKLLGQLAWAIASSFETRVETWIVDRKEVDDTSRIKARRVSQLDQLGNRVAVDRLLARHVAGSQQVAAGQLYWHMVSDKPAGLPLENAVVSFPDNHAFLCLPQVVLGVGTRRPSTTIHNMKLNEATKIGSIIINKYSTNTI